jgi:hypothetical protein
VDEQEHPAGPEPSGPSPSSVTSPITEPATAQPERHRRGRAVRKALSSRGAGWVVAAVLAGAVVTLSVILAAASTTAVLQPVGAVRSFRVVPAGARPAIVSLPPNGPLPGGAWVQVPPNGPLPGGAWVQVPPNGLLPAGMRAQGPAGRWVQVPARVWVQVPAGLLVPAPRTPAPKASAH